MFPEYSLRKYLVFRMISFLFLQSERKRVVLGLTLLVHYYSTEL